MRDEPKNPSLLSLERARVTGGAERCWHNRISVDDDLATVECRDCGEKLNPVAVLSRYAKEESRLAVLKIEHKATRDYIAERRRTRCDHCGKVTQIRGKPTASRWHDEAVAEELRLDA